MTTYEKIVKGATKVKVAAPKPKYIEPILMSTLIDHSVEAENFVTIMKALRGRLQTVRGRLYIAVDCNSHND